MLFVGITRLVSAQELLVNGDFSDGTNGWTHYPLLDGSAAGTINVADDQDRPAKGSGPYLEMFCEGTSYFNQMIFQTFTVQAGDTFDFDGAFKDLTLGELKTWWLELYIGLIPPEEDVDYPAANGIQNGFKTWDGCGPGVDGTFKEDGCVSPRKSMWVAPADIVGDTTAYFIIKTGIYPDNSDPIFYDIAIDELTLTKRGGASAVKQKPAVLLTDFTLYPNCPNPFNPSTTLRFAMPKTAEITLAIYDINGRLVRKLMQETLNSGTYSITWDGRDSRGNIQPSGVYLCRLQSGSYSKTQRLILMK